MMINYIRLLRNPAQSITSSLWRLSACVGVCLLVAAPLRAGEILKDDKDAKAPPILEKEENQWWHVGLSAEFQSKYGLRGSNIFLSTTYNDPATFKLNTLDASAPDYYFRGGDPTKTIFSVADATAIAASTRVNRRTLNDSGVFIANLTASILDFNLGISYLVPTEKTVYGIGPDSDEFSDLDIYGSYSHSLGDFRFTAGGLFRYYAFNQSLNDFELSFATAYTRFQPWVVPSLRYIHNFKVGNSSVRGAPQDDSGQMLEARIDSSVPVYRDIVRIQPYVKLDYSFSYYNLRRRVGDQVVFVRNDQVVAVRLRDPNTGDVFQAVRDPRTGEVSQRGSFYGLPADSQSVVIGGRTRTLDNTGLAFFESGMSVPVRLGKYLTVSANVTYTVPLDVLENFGLTNFYTAGGKVQIAF